MPASLLPPYFFQADAVPRNVFNIPPGGVCAAVIHKDSPAGTTPISHTYTRIYIKRERERELASVQMEDTARWEKGEG